MSAPGQLSVEINNLVSERLARLGIVPWTMPRGGFYLWCRLPDGLDSAEVARRCLDEGVVLAPGNVFSVSQSAGSFLRFNVAQMAGERTYAAIHAAISVSQDRAKAEF